MSVTTNRQTPAYAKLTLTHRTRLYYLLAIGVIAVLLLFGFVALHDMTSRQETSGRLINISGQQRWLSQRIALSALTLASTPNPANRIPVRRELGQLIDTMTAHHHQLTTGKLDDNRITPLSTEIYALYFDAPINANRQVIDYLRQATAVLELPDNQLAVNSPELVALLQNSVTILDTLDQLVTQYEVNKSAAVVQLEQLELALLVINLTILAIVTVVIFRPMERLIASRESQLNTEIERRKIIETALRHSEEAYRLIASNMPNTAIIMYDLDMKITVADGPFLKTAGYNKSEIENQLLKDVIPAQSYEVLLPYYQAALRGETANIERDLGHIAYRSQFVPVLDENQQIFGGMVTSFDVTQRKRAQEALRASEERFRLIANQAPVGIFQGDEQGNCTYANPRWCELTATTLENEIGTNPIVTMHPEDVPIVTKKWQQAFHTHTGFGLEFRVVRPDKSITWLSGLAAPLHDADGNIREFLAVIADITDQKLAQQQEIDLELERESVKLLSEFIKNTSHELRTPLSVISTSAYLISRLEDSQKRQSKLALLNAEINHMSRLIDDFQTMAVLDTAFSIHQEQIHVDDLIKNISDEVKPRMEEKQIAFTYDIDHKLPAFSGDLKHIVTAIKHLLDNAIRFTPTNGRINIQSSLEHDTHGDMITIRISDTGMGIAEAELTEIFKPLYKINQARTNDGSGSGLGLAIVQKIIGIHHGKLSVQSELGKGSTFAIALPLTVQIATLPA